jgi:hypothetical protein
LLTILALSLMPFGMPAARAAPLAQAGHCGSQHDEQSPEPTKAKIHCVGCTALPVVTPGLGRPHLPRTPELAQASVVRFRGIHLEIATPPPKVA